MRLRYLLSAAAILGLSACGSNNAPPDTNEEASASATADTAGAASSAAPMTVSAQSFVNQASASDMFEIESSKLAANMAKDPAVKSFASRMITDHTKSTADLKAAAAKATPAVKVAPALSPDQQADLDALKNAGADFDKLYAQKQVAGHQKALMLLHSYALNGDSPPLKDFARNTAPVVNEHLDMARKLPQ